MAACVYSVDHSVYGEAWHCGIGHGLCIAQKQSKSVLAVSSEMQWTGERQTERLRSPSMFLFLKSHTGHNTDTHKCMWLHLCMTPTSHRSTSDVHIFLMDWFRSEVQRYRVSGWTCSHGEDLLVLPKCFEWKWSARYCCFVFSISIYFYLSNVI